MENSYSITLKKLTGKTTAYLKLIPFLFLLVVTALLGANRYIKDKKFIELPPEELSNFDSSFPIGYTKLTPYLLSDPFASNFDDSILYYFAVDYSNKPYIVAIASDEADQYQDLIDFTFDESLTASPPYIIFEGESVEINSELIDLAIESFNIFWGSDSVNRINFQSILGNYYLDTTQKRTMNYNSLLSSIISFLFFGVLTICYIKQISKQSKQTKATLSRYQDSVLQMIDQELNSPDIISYKKHKLYITKNYIVSVSHGLRIVPLEEIVHLYGLAIKGNKNRIIAETKNGEEEVVAEIRLTEDGELLYNEFVNKIRLILPDIQYGFEDGYFSKVATASTVEVDNEGVRSNPLLGTIGAILGAALGGVIWIIIGKFGFIAGIAGFAMMYFAIKGYRILSGGLDKKGQIISLITAFLMIFIANYTLYAIEYCDYYYSGTYSFTNIINSYSKLYNFLSFAKAWPDFLKDLAIGYALSIWSGFGIIRTVLSKNVSSVQ